MSRGFVAAHDAAFELPPRSNTVGRYIEAAVYALLALFFAYVGVLCAVGAFASAVSAVKMLCVLLVTAALLYAACRVRRGERAVLVCILALAAVLRVFYVFAVPTQPSSDFALLYSSAQSTVNGDLSWANVTEGYFSWWHYQIPFVLYEAFVLKLVNSMAVLKLLNVMWSVGAVYFVYRIVKCFSTTPCAFAAALLAAVYPGFIVQVSVLTNQHISLFFILFGLTVLFETRSYLGCAVSGVLMALGNLMRPEAAIVIAALCCVGLCRFIECPTKKSFARIIFSLAAVVLAYFAFQKAAELVLHALGYAPYGIDNAVPEWKLIVGLDMESGGVYSDKYAYLLDILDSTQRKKEAHAVLLSHFLRKNEWMWLFQKKIEYFWTASQADGFNLSGVNMAKELFLGISIEKLTYLLVDIERAILALTYLMSAVSCALYARSAFAAKRESASAAPLCIAAVLCGTVLAYLFIEIQPRYRMFAMPFVFAMAAQMLKFIRPVKPTKLWKK